MEDSWFFFKFRMVHDDKKNKQPRASGIKADAVFK